MKFTCRQKSNTRFKVSSNLGTFLAILSTWSQCKSTSLQWAISSGKVCCAIERTAVYKLHIQSWSALFLWSLLLYMPTTYFLPKTVQLQVAPLCSVWGFNYSYKFQIPTTTQRSPGSPEVQNEHEPKLMGSLVCHNHRQNHLLFCCCGKHNSQQSTQW